MGGDSAAARLLKVVDPLQRYGPAFPLMKRGEDARNGWVDGSKSKLHRREQGYRDDWDATRIVKGELDIKEGGQAVSACV